MNWIFQFENRHVINRSPIFKPIYKYFIQRDQVIEVISQNRYVSFLFSFQLLISKQPTIYLLPKFTKDQRTYIQKNMSSILNFVMMITVQSFNTMYNLFRFMRQVASSLLTQPRPPEITNKQAKSEGKGEAIFDIPFMIQSPQWKTIVHFHYWSRL